MKKVIHIDLGRGKKRVPFSVGRIVDGLQAAGVETDDALRIARTVEKGLHADAVKTVAEEDLRSRVATCVEKDLGKDVAALWARQVPPYVPLLVTRDKGDPKPFSRRRLAGSLEGVGLPFKEAWALAQQIEQGIRVEGTSEIPRGAVPQRVALALEARYGRETRVRYEATLSAQADLLVRESDGEAWPFSRGILARSLTAIGLAPELAYQLAKRVEEALWREVGATVDREDVRDRVTGLLREEAGEEFAQRYDLMRLVRQPERPIVVLIGGTAGIGKSEFASELAYRLGIARVVSTDSVRQALRSLISAELSPVLHESSYSAWMAELLPEEREGAQPKRRAVIRGFQSQVMQLGPAMRAIAERNVTEATSVVIEGIHIVPGVSHGPVEGAIVVEFVLTVPDEHVHETRFEKREGRTGSRRPKGPYVEHFEEIRMLQQWLVRRAHDDEVPVLDVTDLDEAADRAVEIVLDAVLAAHDVAMAEA